MIWLHGLGADGHDFEPVVAMLDLGVPVRFVFPHAPVRPVTVNGGMEMRARYDIDPRSPLRVRESGLTHLLQGVSNLFGTMSQVGQSAAAATGGLGRRPSLLAQGMLPRPFRGNDEVVPPCPCAR